MPTKIFVDFRSRTSTAQNERRGVAGARRREPGEGRRARRQGAHGRRLTRRRADGSGLHVPTQLPRPRRAPARSALHGPRCGPAPTRGGRPHCIACKSSDRPPGSPDWSPGRRSHAGCSAKQDRAELAPPQGSSPPLSSEFRQVSRNSGVSTSERSASRALSNEPRRRHAAPDPRAGLAEDAEQPRVKSDRSIPHPPWQAGSAHCP